MEKGWAWVKWVGGDGELERTGGWWSGGRGRAGVGGGGVGGGGDSECWIDQMKSGSTSKLLSKNNKLADLVICFVFGKDIIICLFPIVILLVENTGCGFSQVVNLSVCVSE